MRPAVPGTSRADRSRRERGAAAVEFFLAVPALILVVFAGLQLGIAVSAKTRLSDATSIAARSGAIAARGNGAVDSGALQALVSTRMTGTSECTQVTTTVDASGTCPGFLAVTATCTLNPAPFIGKIFNNLGLTQVSATSGMPIDCEPAP